MYGSSVVNPYFCSPISENFHYPDFDLHGRQAHTPAGLPPSSLEVMSYTEFKTPPTGTGIPCALTRPFPRYADVPHINQSTHLKATTRTVPYTLPFGCTQAVERVAADVAERLASIGSDRQLWPAEAREAATRAETRAASLAASVATLQSKLREGADAQLYDRRHLVRWALGRAKP